MLIEVMICHKSRGIEILSQREVQW